MEQLSQQWQILWDSHAVQPRPWGGVGPLALLSTELVFSTSLGKSVPRDDGIV